MRRAIGKCAVTIIAAIRGPSSAIPTIDAISPEFALPLGEVKRIITEVDRADRTVPVYRRRRPSARSKPRPADRDADCLCAVRALLHLRQGFARRQADRRGAR